MVFRYRTLPIQWIGLVILIPMSLFGVCVSVLIAWLYQSHEKPAAIIDQLVFSLLIAFLLIIAIVFFRFQYIQIDSRGAKHTACTYISRRLRIKSKKLERQRDFLSVGYHQRTAYDDILRHLYSTTCQNDINNWQCYNNCSGRTSESIDQ